MNPDGSKLCVAGTMDDYAALVDRKTMTHKIFDTKTTGHAYTKPYWTTEGLNNTCWISLSADDSVANNATHDSPDSKTKRSDEAAPPFNGRTISAIRSNDGKDRDQLPPHCIDSRLRAGARPVLLCANHNTELVGDIAVLRNTIAN